MRFPTTSSFQELVTHKKLRDKYRPLYIAFVDQEKVFDRVPHGIHLVCSTIKPDIQRPAPLTLLYGDDVSLASNSEVDL